MTRTRPANDSAGRDTIVISAYGWVDDTVRGHHDGARETSELHLLILPAAATQLPSEYESTLDAQDI